MKKLFFLFVSMFTLLAFADIIYFNNNDIDEGFAKIKDNIVIIKSKKRNCEYGISTNQIIKIDYGKWFKDFQYEYETEKMDKADARIIVIGNSYFDAHEALWQELEDNLKSKNMNLYIESLTHKAATFQSVLENNSGKLTKHQKDALQQLQESFNQVVSENYDSCDLNEVANFSIEKKVTSILDSRGQINKMLSRNITWNYVVLIPFIDAEKVKEYNFFNSGRNLIKLIRKLSPKSKIIILTPWCARGAKAQPSIDKNCRLLAEKNNTLFISTSGLIDKYKGNLYSSRYTPNNLGIKLIANEIANKLISNKKGPYLKISFKKK